MKDYKQHFVILNTLTIFVIMKTKVQFTYLDYLFKEVYAVKSKHYPDSTFFKNDDKVMLELEKSGMLWVIHSVWSNISNMLSLEYDETQQLIKEWMEEQLKLGEVTPQNQYRLSLHLMEEQLKLGEVTPFPAKRQTSYQMEKLLKLGEVTPSLCKGVSSYRMEEQLKLWEVTPIPSIDIGASSMEEQLNTYER